MQKKLRYIIWLFIFGCLQTKSQTLLQDSINARYERQEYSLIIFPAYYRELSHRFDLTKIKDTDSFSLRLWTGGMFGHELFTFIKQKDLWDSHRYEYRSDSSLKELKIKPKITLTDFVKGLQAFNFNELISQRQIKNFQDDVDDGTTYTLEIIIGKSYKVFQYHSPESFSDNDNKTFSSIISLIGKYFWRGA